ncbi:CoB--CoM heterodisulfide reductase iron-sulfur subunit A family protein [uncultured Phascolarctobacterium sp.]|uniref:CoB--CoM heterodisulfide reductase iron-sulfur subunit A family protein n=1 Tax=uncultured Phascolarctobacterium sp. TaxID=512296 RepID=UPI002625F6AF|nr:CoB--CoM heterodisulfide reductase iron-sulfur subunit A family protein [uncultured Phascolarctobacterium sp.]
MQKIGVFVCWCGSNIAGTVDVAAVAEAVRQIPDVVFATDYKYMCSEQGQAIIRQAVQDYQLDRIVVCSCSPRMHEATFRKCAESVGINPYMVEIANIREQCSWVLKDKAEATAKAIKLAKAAIAKVRFNTPLHAGKSSVVKRALVIGGGIAGIQTALDIAEAGYKVDIVEKEPTIGGRMAQLDKTFPTLDCSACILTPKMVDAAQHENITLYTYSEVEKVSGFVGNFDVTIRKKARSVKADMCSGCGLCTEKCPSRKTPSEFDMNLKNRGAIYIPFAQAIPKVPVIDRDACLKFKTGKCGICSMVCPCEAIDYTQQDELVTEKYGAIVLATGFELLPLDKFADLGWGVSKDVISSLQLERLTNAAGPTEGHLVCPSSGKEPKSVVIVSCVGSRDTTERGKTYCSKICCMYNAKHAMYIREKYPNVDVTVFYIDVRTPGKGFDEFQRRAVEEYGVHYVRGQVGKVVVDGDGKLTVFASDLNSGRHLMLFPDLVVLAAAVKPAPDARKLATMLTASIDNDDFYVEAHPKLRPVESPTAGIFLSGMCQGPKDIPETVSQAGAAAAKVIGLLAKDHLETNPCTAVCQENICSGCKTCAHVCPYGAITYADKQIITLNGTREQRTVAVVNEALCQGCGACTVACPSTAMDLKGFTNKQILAEVDALC